MNDQEQEEQRLEEHRLLARLDEILQESAAELGENDLQCVDVAPTVAVITTLELLERINKEIEPDLAYTLAEVREHAPHLRPFLARLSNVL